MVSLPALLLGLIILVPAALWVAMRRIWMVRLEKKVLRAKYGDLDMFAERLKEWNVF